MFVRNVVRTGVVALLLATGCSGPAAPGTVDWQPLKGTLVGVEAGDMSAVMKATLGAMKDLGLRPMVRTSDAYSASIVGNILVGTLSQERELFVTLTRLTDTTTEVALHIIFTRDRHRLDLVLAEITKRLPTQEKVASAP